jgi:hypothetical protein
MAPPAGADEAGARVSARHEPKTVAQKGHVKPGTRIAVVNRAPGIVESLGLPAVTFVRSGHADLVFLFVRTRAELETHMPRAVGRLGSGAALWVFFRKGSKGAGLDMSRNTVWAVAERLDLRPLGLLAVDETWSVFRLRRAHAGRPRGSAATARPQRRRRRARG